MTYFDLSGNHALLTGATGPLQRALAVGLAEAGANVSVTTTRDRPEEQAQAISILDACRSIGRAGEALTVDLMDEAGLETWVASLEQAIAPVDILVNATHAAVIKPFLETSAEELGATFDTNTAAVFAATRAVGRRMLERGSGRVVNIVSILHDRGVPNCAVYAATQGAVLGFTKALAIEWVRQGVTVNALGIGFFEDVPGPQQDPELRAVLERYIPLRRLGTGADLQGALVYLASDEAAWVNAELVVVDGAISAHG